jgi:cell division protein ZapA (FtsZ GTPase activity inhibitor)
MGEIKKQTITIFDESYTIVSDEPEELLSQAILHINEVMNNLSEKSGLNDKKKIALLSALHLATELQKVNQKIAFFEEQEKKLIATVDKQLQNNSVGFF